VPDPHRRSGGRDFLELGRLGVGGWKPVVDGVVRLLVYVYGGSILIAIALRLLVVVTAPSLKAVLGHDLFTVLGSVGWLAYVLGMPLLGGLAVRHTLRYAERRPFLSVIAPDQRFDWRRAVRGCLAWCLASAVVTVAMAAAVGTWPKPTANAALLLYLPVILVLVPLQSAAEEIVFRGWFAQLFRKLTADRVIVSMFVAILFSAAHGSVYGPMSFPYYVVVSLIFSFVVLRDQRLELAIGAHAGNNLFCLLVVQRSDSPIHTPALFTAATEGFSAQDFGELILGGMLFALLVFWPRHGTARPALVDERPSPTPRNLQ
jgi:membrane protease YdiL (CAAX protease family)